MKQMIVFLSCIVLGLAIASMVLQFKGKAVDMGNVVLEKTTLTEVTGYTT